MHQLHEIPTPGLKGIVKHWRSDFLAAISVALVALPLGLGVAIASGAPPISGLISAIIGGIIATLFRGSHLAINGPAAGLIAVILSATYSLDDGSGRTLNYVLAAITIAGGLQVILGLLKLGRIADVIPSSVIQGVMVAIGIIIISTQIHVVLGTHSDATGTIDKLADVWNKIPEIHPIIFLISASGILLLVFLPKVQSRLLHFFPPSLWVLIVSVIFVFAFNFFETHSINLGGLSYEIGPEYLIKIPSDLSQALIFPDYSKINTLSFWIAVVSICLIASIQTLAMAKAVDKLDPYKRKSNLDKDLIGMGIATVVSGAIGGLPIITVIVRSTVNITNNAKTKWSNFYHGILILLFLLVLAPVIQMVPLAALSAILVYIGFRLASPSTFKRVYEMGIEQLIFMVVTIVITLYTDLLWGIIGGTAFTLLVHILLSRLSPPSFFKMAFDSGSNVFLRKEGKYELHIKGIANFLSIPSVDKLIKTIPSKSDVMIRLSETRLIDMTFMEFIVDFLRNQEESGAKVQFEGLQNHVASSTHNRALKISFQAIDEKLSPRQERLKNIADENGYQFESQVNWNTSYLRNFHFFEIRPIERKLNQIRGRFEESQIDWELADVIFNEGAAFSAEVFHTTVMILHLGIELPSFSLEKEGVIDKLFDRVMAFSGYDDIDFKMYTKFSKKFLLMGQDEEAIKSFFTPKLISFLENEQVYHIESNGNALLIFNKLKLARTDESLKFIAFSKKLATKILSKNN